MQGGVIRVPVPGGEKKVRIPPSPAQNHRLRLKGIGPGGGDILYQLDIQVPAVPPEAEELLEKLAKILPSGEELRKGLWK
jgi:DnaJ-class molecular chaperone